MIEKFIKVPVEIYNKKSQEEYENMGLDIPAPCETIDMYIEVSQIESFRHSYLLDREDIPCTCICLKSGDSCCALLSVEEFIKLIPKKPGFLKRLFKLK